MNQNINIKVMKKPELTDEEIRSHMQFDKLLEAYKGTGLVGSSERWLYTAAYVILAVLFISTALYFFLPGTNKMDDQTSQPLHTFSHDSTSQANRQRINQSAPKIEIQKKKITPTSPKISAKGKNAKKTDSTETIRSQFTEAEPVDGYSALYAYFDRELKYPADAVRDSIEGVVTVSFLINKDGKPDQIKIENSLGTAFDKECQRIINSMPLWKPAIINGKPISTRLSIPLTFKITK